MRKRIEPKIEIINCSDVDVITASGGDGEEATDIIE